MSARIYAARKKLKTLLLAKNLGGQPAEAWKIENYLGFQSISGPELIQEFISHLKKFKDDIEIKEGESAIVVEPLNKIAGKNFYQITTDKNKYQARAILNASGAVPRKLEIPG